jgi:Sec-independent protein translocase protein TatA
MSLLGQEAAHGKSEPDSLVTRHHRPALGVRPTRLAGAGKGLGEGIRSFKKGLSEDADDEKKAEKSDKAEEPKALEPAEKAAPPKTDEPKSA